MQNTNLHQSKKACPLIVESHPASYTGFPFITLIQYHKDILLTVVDNVTDEYIKAYVLDLCTAEGIDEERLMNLALQWYHKDHKTPFSVFLSLNGVSSQMSKVCRTYPIEYISRIIGPIHRFPFSAPKNTRKRRRKVIPTVTGR